MLVSYCEHGSLLSWLKSKKGKGHDLPGQVRAIIGQNIDIESVDLNTLVDTDRSRDRIFVGTVKHITWLQAPALDQFVDKRVVLGQLVDPRPPNEINSTVAHMTDEASLPCDEEQA